MGSMKRMKTVSVKEFPSVVSAAMKGGHTLYVEGNPGIGKSAIVNGEAKKLGLNVVDIRAILYDVGDLVMKIPNHEHTELVEIVADILPKEKGSVLFLDEFRHAPPEIRRLFYQLVLDKKIGSCYTLPEGTAIITASNKTEDVATDEMEGPLFDRWELRVELDVPLKDWQAWAVDQENSALVMGYLNYFSDDFRVIDKENDSVLVTPRRWEMVMKNINLYQYILPENVSIRFGEFIKKVNMFKDIDGYIGGKIAFPKATDDQYAVMTAIMAEQDVRKDKALDTIVDNIMDLKMKDIDDEIKALLVFSTLRGYKRKKKLESVRDMIIHLKNGDKIMSVLTQYKYVTE